MNVHVDHRPTERGLCRSARPVRKPGPLRIFISYRWSDSWAEAQLLHHDLVKRFGHRNVFIDTARISDGAHIPVSVTQALERSDVVLAVIGPTWLTAATPSGRRLDDPDDVVRSEIVQARALNLRLVPVMLHGIDPPATHDLPEPIRWISYRMGTWLNRNTWKTDVVALVDRLEKQRPRNRFASFQELGDLASWRALIINAVTKPCAIAFGALIAVIGVPGDRGALIWIGVTAYVLLSAIAFFTLYEAETVGAQEQTRSTGRNQKDRSDDGAAGEPG